MVLDIASPQESLRFFSNELDIYPIITECQNACNWDTRLVTVGGES